MSVHIDIHEYFALPQIGQQATQIGIQGGLADTAFDALVMVTLKTIESRHADRSRHSQRCLPRCLLKPHWGQVSRRRPRDWSGNWKPQSRQRCRW